MKKGRAKRNYRSKIKKNSKVSLRKRATAKVLKLWVRRIFLVIIGLVTVISFCIGVTFLLTKILCIKAIIVKENPMYTQQQIIESSGISLGDGLIFTNAKKAEEKVYESLPYIDEVKITKGFPDKIEIALELAQPEYVVNLEGQYAVISKKGKVVERLAQTPENLMLVSGINARISEKGKIEYESEKLCAEIIESFKNRDLNGVKEINVADMENIWINYEGRLRIDIGNGEDSDYKILTAKEIITGKIGSSEKGILDLKSLKSENRSYFSTQDPEFK